MVEYARAKQLNRNAGHSQKKEGVLNRKLLRGILLLCIPMFAATTLSATTFRTERFSLSGNGSFMSVWPTFSGNITGGTLYPGTFWISFDDTAWPSDNPGTPENERLDYIMAHYFHYDATPGAECWDGYFPPSGSGEPMPKWRFFTVAGDTLGGSCTQITITIKDLNANGIMEASEYASKVISGNMVAYINYGGGCFTNFCGTGSFSGTLNVVNAETLAEELYVPSPALPSGRLYMKDGGCTVGVEPSSWGTIKSIYR
jgi:hypothetical protein